MENRKWPSVQLAGFPISGFPFPVLHSLLSPVERLLSEVLQPQCGIIRSSRDLARDTGIDDLADEHGVITLLDGADQRALDKGGGVGQDRRSRLAGAKRLTANGVAGAF